ncbi:helix-turn-helix transcriptional regulator [Brevibacillus sp. LEMMJ03]|uniref:helix-turn-helix domain-containing protein n=1 Tax=Brevibacillus TaxID=55080 RepID=UPI00054E3548|nr:MULTISPECIES: helix-turn-helix transcriptional regulator [Brevibacillus]TRY23645.1 helix-turn-helix transcriptional regulator [Brevibacillus sp. LEMMJ03]
MHITVKAARVNAGMTQEEVAKKLNLSTNGYAKKESGKSRFYIDEIIMLGKLFGVNYENFCEVACHLKTRRDTA